MLRIFLLVLFGLIAFSDQATKIYTPLPIETTIFNPERGFYIHTEVFSNAPYQALDLISLNEYKLKSHSIILRVFYLEKFLKSDISVEYLNNIKYDFETIRKAGLKCIVRFAYSNDGELTGSLDASKAQVLRHIDQLKPILQQNSDLIFVVQAGFIGAWGEWYYTDNFGYPEPNSIDMNNRKDILLALLLVLPTNRMIQIRTPYYKRTLFSSDTPLTITEAFKQTAKSRVGHHNDCFLASSDDYGTYVDSALEYPYLETDTLYTPMGGETCNPNPPRSSCVTALNELKRFHWSYLNVGYHEEVIQGFKNGGCYSTIENKLGYRFELISATIPDVVSLSQKQFNIQIVLKNNGFASLFNERSVYLVLRESTSLKEYSIKLNTDPRFWYGDSQTTINENVILPTSILTGNYKLYLNLPDSSITLNVRPEYSIRLANKDLWEPNTGYNSLLHFIILTA